MHTGFPRDFYPVYSLLLIPVGNEGYYFFDCPGVVYPHTGMKSRTMGKAARVDF